MLEEDYLNTSNLARIRIAIAALNDVVVNDGKDREDRAKAYRALDAWKDRLLKKINITDDPAKESRG